MAKRKGNQPNGKAQSANHGSHLQKKRDGGKPGKAVATKVAQLEVPEGYRPQRGKGNKRRRGKKLIASDNSNFNQTERELQQQTSTMSITPMEDELQIDLSPTHPRPVLTFNTDRKWVSVDNPEVYLPQYAEYQMRKYDPPVFAVEVDNSKTRELQRRRRLYFKTRGRLDRLAVLENVKDWPYKFGIPTRAPFIRCSEHAPTENTGNRDLPIFRAMAIPELASRILNHCAPHFQDLANLGLTCWTAFGAVQSNTEHWNITDQDFLGYNTGPLVRAHKPNPGIVVVSPVRPEMKIIETVRRDTDYFSEFNGLVQLFHALENRASTIMNLHLHRVPFLSLAAVECIVASLPHLRDLGLYQCRLLHFGTTLKLLEIIERHQTESVFVHLDFFPNFHQGPNSSDRKGSFGVTWEDPGLNTTAGILQLALYHHYPKARSMGFDLFDPSSAYRLWLEKCPLPDWTVVRAYEAVRTYETHRKMRDFTLDWMVDSDDPAFQRLADELAAAIFADEPEPGIVPQGVLISRLPQRRYGDLAAHFFYRRDGWWRRQSQCSLRCIPTPGPIPTGPILDVFFPYLNQQCYGCRLLKRMGDTNDHFKEWQVRAMEMWLGHKREKYTLEQALASQRQWNAARYAWDTDVMVEHDKTHGHGSDVTDLIWRIDLASLRHRYHREQEPHGPVNRRRGEWQYSPIGEENIQVTFQTVTPALFSHYFFSAEWYQKVAKMMAKRNPGMTWNSPGLITGVRPALVNNARAELDWLRVDHHARNQIAHAISTRDAHDRQYLLWAHREWQALVRRPNRPARNWDEMRNEVFDEIERAVNNGRLIRAKAVDPQWTRTAHHRN